MTSALKNCFLVQMPTQSPEQLTDSNEQFNRPNNRPAQSTNSMARLNEPTQLTDSIDRLNQPTQTVITYH